MAGQFIKSKRKCKDPVPCCPTPVTTKQELSHFRSLNWYVDLCGDPVVMLINKFLVVSLLSLTCASAQDLVTTRLDDQQRSFTFTNAYTQQLTGATVKIVRRTAGAPEAKTTLIYDCFLNQGQPPLAPGESYAWNFGSDVSSITITLDAAIFSDGTAQGTNDGLKSLWRRRSLLAGCFREIFSLLDQHPEMLQDRERAVTYLKASQQTRTSPQASVEEQAAVQTAYGTFLAGLTGVTAETPADGIHRLRDEITARIAEMEHQPAPGQIRGGGN